MSRRSLVRRKTEIQFERYAVQGRYQNDITVEHRQKTTNDAPDALSRSQYSTVYVGMTALIRTIVSIHTV